MRREIERRSALIACGGLVLGLATPHAPLIFLCAAGVFLLNSLQSRVVFAVFLFVGLLMSPAAPANKIIEQEVFKGFVTVASVPRLYEGRQTCEVDSGGQMLVLFAPAEADLVLGDRIEIAGYAKPLSETGEAYWLSRGVIGVLEPVGMGVTRRGSAFAVIASKWRRGFLDFTEQRLDPRLAKAVDALCFNVDTQLDERFKDQLQRSGTVHIISASGLHVLILASGLFFAMSWLPLPRSWQLVILIAVLLLYATATGLRPPIIRSVVMSTFLLSAYLFRREPDLLSALAVAAVGYLLWQPRAIFDIGFQLSFVVVGALAMFVRYEPHSGKMRERLTQGLGTAVKASFVATIASAPLVAYHFGQISVASIPANLLIAGVLPFITLGALASFAVAGLAPALAAGIMVALVQPLTAWVAAVVSWFGDQGWAVLKVPEFSPYWIPVIYALILLLWRPRARPA